MTRNSEKFSLKWNDFESNLSSAFTELREEKELFDVTLVCDSNQIEAHKVVISACSPFFRRILKRNQHSHPLLYLKGVPFTDLESVLSFMYQGEASVGQDHLNSFLATAEDLEVKGLTEGRGGAGTSSTPASHNHSRLMRGTQPPPPNFNSGEAGDSDIQEIVPVKMEASFNSGAVEVEDPQEEGYEYQEQEGFQYEDYNAYVSENIGLDQGSMTSQEIDDLIKLKMVKTENTFLCTDCDYRTQLKCNIEKHIEAQHIRPGVFCKFCSKVCPTRHALRMHLKRNHNTIPSILP